MVNANKNSLDLHWTSQEFLTVTQGSTQWNREVGSAKETLKCTKCPFSPETPWVLRASTNGIVLATGNPLLGYNLSPFIKDESGHSFCMWRWDVMLGPHCRKKGTLDSSLLGMTVLLIWKMPTLCYVNKLQWMYLDSLGLNRDFLLAWLWAS